MAASYEIAWKPSALEELKRLPKPAIRRIVTAVEALREEPRPPGVRKLSGAEHSYRLRIGEYRIVYDVDASRLVIEILRARNRKDVYRRR